MVVVAEASGVADVCSLHASEVGFPGGSADRGVTAGAYGIDGSIGVGAMGKCDADWKTMCILGPDW